MRIILHGTKHVATMARAAEVALKHWGTDAKAGELIGLRVDGRYFSVRWNRSSLSVRLNDEDAA